MSHRWIGAAFVASALMLVEARASADVGVCISANDEALAMRKAGRLRDALERLTACTDPACPDEVRVECNARITEFQAILPRLLIAVTDARGAEIAADVMIDGVSAKGYTATPTPIDPGTHVVRVSSVGMIPVERTIVMHAGETQRREVIALSPPSFWTTQRILGASAAGLGLAGLVAGAVFTGFAASAKSRESSDCSASSCPNRSQAVADYNAAASNATGAEAGFVAGGVLAAASIVLFATATAPVPSAFVTGRRLTVTPWAGAPREGCGLRLGGSF